MQLIYCILYDKYWKNNINTKYYVNKSCMQKSYYIYVYGDI